MRVAIIGGGAIGAACAMFLRRLAPQADVTVVEPDPTLALASSARSAASIRQQFSTELNVRLSQFGLEVLRDSAAWLSTNGAPVPLDFVESGYLFVATTDAGAQALRERHAVQRAAHAPVTLLDRAALQQRCPWLNTGDVLLASVGEHGEGWFDGEAFARALARQARALGARWHVARVTGFERAGRAMQALQLSDGASLQADAFVLATGAWSHAVGALGDLPVPVYARRRTVFAFECPTPLPRPTPLVIDPAGVWFRGEGSGFIGGWSPGEHDNDPDDLPLDEPDLAQFDDQLWPALAQRVPAFEALRRSHAWAGYYEVHPLDHNGLVGPHPDCANLILACGFSGHGLQHAPGVGRGVAEWIVHGRYRSLDLSPLTAERLRTGRALAERAVI